jgi:hypothetical protein
MKSQPKSPLAQLNLPLLDPVAIALPAGKDQQPDSSSDRIAVERRQRTNPSRR